MLTALRAILRTAARSLGVERAAHAALIEEMWPEIVGPEAAPYCRVAGMRGTVLLADAEAGPWAQELSARRGHFIRQINGRLGAPVVSEIRFRQTMASLPKRPPEAAAPAPAAAKAEPSPDELRTVEQALAEIADPDVREAARRAMLSHLRWRKRQKAETER